MSRLVTLMYHGLYADDRELQQTIDPADRPYAVSTTAFERQLDLIQAEGLTIVDPRRLGGPLPARGVLLTFDDGQVSNHHHATRILAQRGLQAVFFVTSDFIGGGRPHFCSWEQLREMDGQGMVIGSHGRTHRFFDDLSPADAAAEFRDSRDRIQQGVGRAVEQISFPGGRYRRDQLAVGRELGYTVFHTSEVGVFGGAAVPAGAEVPRIAVRNSTDDTTFMAFAAGSRRAVWKAQAIAAAKSAVRRTAGNRLYHLMYEKFAR
jgi:peptidoglycan/xylan/chitin deacetylase (PgdA/CDA1 family)